jgi:hypothetical protein
MRNRACHNHSQAYTVHCNPITANAVKPLSRPRSLVPALFTGRSQKFNLTRSRVGYRCWGSGSGIGAGRLRAKGYGSVKIPAHRKGRFTRVKRPVRSVLRACHVVPLPWEEDTGRNEAETCLFCASGACRYEVHEVLQGGDGGLCCARPAL